MRILIAKNAHTKTLKEKIIWAAPAESGALLNIELAGTTFPDAEYRIARGGTSFFVIEAVLSGKGFIESEDTRLCVQAGDCYFLNRDMPVTYYADRKDPYQKIWVNLSGRLVDGLVLSYGIHGAVLVSHAPLSPLLSTLHSLLKKEDCEERKALLIHRMIRMFADEKFSQKHSDPPHAYTIRNWCDRHFSSKATLSDAAQALFLSRAQIIRVFRQAYGETPYAYMLRRRIETAKQLLRNTSMPLSQIAERLAFSDLHHFSHSFRQQEGIAPGIYRKSNHISDKNENTCP